MIQYKIYSSTNLLNIPRELYKTKDSNSAFKTSSLFFGPNFRNSYKNSINTYASDRVSSFAKFFANSLNSINDSANIFTNKVITSNIDIDANMAKVNTLANNEKGYFESNKKLSDIAPDLGIFINNVNSFLEETKKYDNDNVRILNKQLENDLLSSKDDLYAFGIRIADNKLYLDEEKLSKSLENIDRLNLIVQKSDNVFNKIADRTTNALNDPISKYIPLVNDKNKDTSFSMFNYLSNSQKFALNSSSSSGTIIDYVF